jgi:hypothetical protein
MAAMSAKELRLECPACRARLAIDVRTEKVVTWQTPERPGRGGRPDVDEDQWTRAAKRVAERGERSQDRFEAALAKEARRTRDLDDLFAGGRSDGGPTAATAQVHGAWPDEHTDAWYARLDAALAAVDAARAGARVESRGGARLARRADGCELSGLAPASEAELEALLAAVGDGPARARVAPGADAARVQQRLAAHGFAPAGLEPVLVHRLDELPSVPGHARAAARGDFEAWCRVAAEGEGDAGRASRLAALRSDFAGEAWRLFVARDRGEVVAAAALLLVGDVAVLAHAATVPEQRGRGHLRALVAAQLAAAAAAGARLAVARLAVARGEPALAALRASLAQGLRLAYHEAHWRRDGAARG